MARTKLQRLLPRLPSRSLLRPKENKSGDLLSILRTTAIAAQGAESKAFYSLREVAQHFRVPLSTVARTYKRLENENLISRIRGSRTILQGTDPTRHLIVRSVVGMPASLSCFLTLQDYRMFFSKVRRELRRRGLLPAIVFYEDRADSGDLAERIRQARADVVLWYLSDSVARRTAPWLRDLGIRTVGISDGGWPHLPCRYEVRRETAIRAILEDWVGSGIRNVRIARGEGRSSADEERLEALLAETPLSWRFVDSASGSTENFLVKLSTHKDKAIIVLASAAAFFSMRAPEAFNKMLHNCRVAFLDGPVSMPLTRPAAVLLDLVVVDWQGVARRIAEDILSREAFTNGKPIVFEAMAELRARLDKFAQKI
jgi:hypothetical protein